MLTLNLLIELSLVKESLLNEEMFEKYEKRSLTRDESSKLKVPLKDLDCSVMHFKSKSGKQKDGYAAYTHRCWSGLYDSPDKIPEKKLKFISSTS
jgi:hypothetical protein